MRRRPTYDRWIDTLEPTVRVELDRPWGGEHPVVLDLDGTDVTTAATTGWDAPPAPPLGPLPPPPEPEPEPTSEAEQWRARDVLTATGALVLGLGSLALQVVGGAAATGAALFTGDIGAFDGMPYRGHPRRHLPRHFVETPAEARDVVSVRTTPDGLLHDLPRELLPQHAPAGHGVVLTCRDGHLQLLLALREETVHGDADGDHPAWRSVQDRDRLLWSIPLHHLDGVVQRIVLAPGAYRASGLLLRFDTGESLQLRVLDGWDEQEAGHLLLSAASLSGRPGRDGTRRRQEDRP